MPLPRLTALSLIAVLLVASGCVLAKMAPKYEQDPIFEDWTYTRGVTKSGTPWIGAFTESRLNNGTNYSLYVVTIDNSCSAHIYVKYDLEFPPDKTFPSEPYTGEISVDDLAPVQISHSNLYGKIDGKGVVLIPFDGILSNKALVDQLSKGQRVQVKVKVANEEMTLRFSLKNFTTAMNRAIDQCKSEQSVNSPGGLGQGAPAQPTKPAGKATSRSGEGGSPLKPYGRPSGDESKYFRNDGPAQSTPAKPSNPTRKAPPQSGGGGSPMEPFGRPSGDDSKYF